jgi:DNA-binding GntR family transcriptional regulator
VFHTEFHAILVSESGQTIARGALELQDHCKRYRRALVEDRPVSTFVIAAKEHAAIAAACRERDTETAVSTLARHLARAALSLSSISDPSHDPIAVREALAVVLGVVPDVRPGSERASARGRRRAEPAR